MHGRPPKVSSDPEPQACVAGDRSKQGLTASDSRNNTRSSVVLTGVGLSSDPEREAPRVVTGDAAHIKMLLIKGISGTTTLLTNNAAQSGSGRVQRDPDALILNTHSSGVAALVVVLVKKACVTGLGN